MCSLNEFAYVVVFSFSFQFDLLLNIAGLGGSLRLQIEMSLEIARDQRQTSDGNPMFAVDRSATPAVLVKRPDGPPKRSSETACPGNIPYLTRGSYACSKSSQYWSSVFQDHL